MLGSVSFKSNFLKSDAFKSDPISDSILDDREKRFECLESLSKDFGQTLVVGHLNYPGNDKNTVVSQKGFGLLENILMQEFENSLIYSQRWCGADGSAIILVVHDAPDISKLKSIMIEETHPLGRIFDIDVLNCECQPISRTSVGENDRLCLLCNEPANHCIVSRKHNLQDVLQKVHKIIINLC